MRYVVAILFAIAGAALAMMFISQNVADNIVASMRFDNPDQVADMHVAIYMATNLAGLLVGWTLGWLIGMPFKKRQKAN
jgi:membrane associated rhomboid family serine protease